MPWGSPGLNQEAGRGLCRMEAPQPNPLHFLHWAQSHFPSQCFGNFSLGGAVAADCSLLNLFLLWASNQSLISLQRWLHTEWREGR